ncbi:hypothetical protein SUGI_0979420 [Cryptomeria japonica]|nr:hypothetical protein SUGI_0979420 [Cryptomeria japonica]
MFFPICKWEFPIARGVDSNILGKIFKFDSIDVEEASRDVTSCDVLHAFPQVLCYSQVISSFLSNAMDLIQDASIIKTLAFNYIQDSLISEDSFNGALSNYDLFNGCGALIGGLFNLFDIQPSPIVNYVYDAMKHGLHNACPTTISNSLYSRRSKLGTQMVEKIKEVF